MTPASDWVTGKVGAYALDFDGSNDWVNAGTSTSLDMGTGDYSVSAWVKTPGGHGGGEGILIMSGGNTSTVNGIWFAMLDSNDSPAVWVSNGSSYVVNQFGGSQAIQDNAWHHVAWVWDRDVGNRMYIDGALNTSNTVINSNNIITDHTFIIGGRDPGEGVTGKFIGSIDDVRVYKRALSATEVSALYNGGAGCQ
jgi:hypothetical protein